MDLGLKDRVALVTGSSRGIGKAIALGLAREGCHVAICARGAEALEATAGELRTTGVRVHAAAVDLADPAIPASLVEETVAALGRLDIVVASAGGNRRGRLEETSDDDWDEILTLNLRAHVRTARAAIPHLRGSDAGSIVFISSIFGREGGGPGLSIYNTTKSAVISLAKILAMELAPEGIRVNSVAPGSIRFPGGSWDRRCKEDPEGMAEFVKRNLPLGRFGMAEEVADLVVYLASPRASLVTGACLNVDGCQSHSLI
jgi:3-oxoacyl-[acyl-carrier protein] reductase